MLEDKMKAIANFILERDSEITFDYYKKYSLTEEDFKATDVTETVSVEDKAIIVDIVDNEETSYEELVARLKEYRMKKASEEGVKPYFIYNNEAMEEIIKVKPKESDELISIRGFGPKKIEKYGQDIINILRG